MGDALAVAVLRARGFSEQDFARTHPGGLLGRRLLLYARDLMHKDNAVPLVKEQAYLPDVLMEMTSKSLGMTGVIDNDQKLVGIFTDGDLRRTLNEQTDVYAVRAKDVMTRDPFTIGPEVLAAEIVHMMREHARHGPHAINGVFVVDEHKRVLGALNTHDLLRAGVL
jgi:arabinose-5-phosphate isomerase